MVLKRLVAALKSMAGELPFWYSRSEFARVLRVSKSPTLIKYLEQFVEEGWLDRRVVLNDRGLNQVEYCISEAYRTQEMEQKEVGNA